MAAEWLLTQAWRPIPGFIAQKKEPLQRFL
jgi:hypothetical protein